MSIVGRCEAGTAEWFGPVYQAEVELGSAPETPLKPPPGGNGAGKAKAAKGANDGAAENAAPEAATDDAAAAAPVEPDSARAAPAPNPLASAIALMTASAPHRHLFISDLEWALLPPIALRQCRVFVKDGRPVGFASWAFVSDEVAARLKSGQTKLKPAEWKSGDRCWLVDLIAPFGGAEQFVKMLTDGVLKEHWPSLSALVQFTVRNEQKSHNADTNGRETGAQT